MKASAISVVLPIHNQEDHIEAVVESHLAGLGGIAVPAEVLLVCNACTDGSERICAGLASRHRGVSHLSLEQPGAGRAYRLGLDAASGDLLCIANSARTGTQLLVEMLEQALELEPAAVLKTTRVRSNDPHRQVGSSLYKLECRLLLGINWEDVNGTPKVFPREFSQLLELKEDYDGIDAEILAICRRQGYPVMERRIPFPARHSGRSTTGLRAAMRTYASVPRIRGSLR